MRYLSWPITVLIILWLLRKEIRQLLSRIKKGKFGAAELEFAERVALVEAEIQGPVSRLHIGNEYVSDDAIEEASTNPRETILNAWMKVEKTINDVIEAKGIVVEARALRTGRNPRTGAIIKIKAATIPALPALRALKKEKIIHGDLVDLIQDLRSMRNEAAHNPDFNPPTSAVVRYTHLSEIAVESLSAAIEE